MRHITKILAVVMAIVLLSGQVAYAGDPWQPFIRRFPSWDQVTDKITEVARKIGPYLVPAVGIGVKMATDPDFRQKVNNRIRTDLSKAKDWMHKNAPYVAIGTFAAAGLIIAKNPALRERFNSAISKFKDSRVGQAMIKYAPLIGLGLVGVTAIRKGGNITGKTGMQGFSKLGGNITGKTGMQGFSKLGGNITGLSK